MDGTEILSIVSKITAGGPEAIVAILVVFIAYLVYERIYLIKQLKEVNTSSMQAKEEEKKVILSIVDRYHGGNLAMVQALNEIKIVLASLQERIR